MNMRHGKTAAAVTEQMLDRTRFEDQRKNIYVCRKCRGHIVTVDFDQGVTPFAIGCRATHGCKGMMESSMYRVFDQSIGASHEWYRPTAPELATMPLAVQKHVDQGGLILRRLTRAMRDVEGSRS